MQPPHRSCGRYFNPRAPCGARLIDLTIKATPSQFQSTRPVRGATTCGRARGGCNRYFNPRAPCGARLDLAVRGRPLHPFQSTRPVRGATLLYQRERRRGRIFQSTRPVRGATGRGADRDDHLRISIHAPRAGRDIAAKKMFVQQLKISIHAPRAGRDACRQLPENTPVIFQSTRPVRGATSASLSFRVFRSISIHAPRAGRDLSALTLRFASPNFNPRAPCGARLGANTMPVF